MVSKGHEVKTIVVDANPQYLKVAQEKGLLIEINNIQNSKAKDADLVTMRAVIHYNKQENQQKIFDKIFKTLKKGGYLVHQNSSGSKENCELRSAIVNLRSLGKVVSDENYKWVSEEECIKMANKAGFKDNKVAGYAPSNAWGPEEQWDRFNKKKTEEAILLNNKTEIELIKKRREIYLQEANKLIEDYIKKYSNEILGIIKKKDDNYLINYTYSIIVSKK